ncbi:MAG: glycosyltransferase family 2 protein [Mycobacteriaceae bacterium]|nr:glycosyltransferase family 2 protein [Mycobacteriaceae bacterium]MBV9638327.1 glycosyltransferase family 2 protein [Mycobacteriaceae bacterium]
MDVTTALQRAFAANSPRLSPRGTPAAGWLIHLAVIALWAALFAQAFVGVGAGFWSIGIAYLGYDTLLSMFVLWQTVPMLRTRPSPARLAAPTVAVLIAAYNEAAVLPATVRSVLAQTDPVDVIVIADDGSVDHTAAVLAACFGLSAPAMGALSEPARHDPRLRWLRLAHAGKAVALNGALLAVDTDVVITMDADTLPARDAVAAIRRAFADDPRLVVAGGVLIPACGSALRNRVLQCFQTYEYMRNFLSRYAWMRVNSLLLISGAFAGFRRAAVLTVGGFDPDCLVEDYELIHRLHRRSRDDRLGWRVEVVGRAVARTDAPGTIVGFLRQRRRWFGGFLQTQYWNRDVTGNPRYGWLGLAMMPVKAVDTVQPVYGLTALVLLVVLAATGNVAVLVPVGAIVLAKLIFDVLAYLWSIHLYRCWTGRRDSTHVGYALLAAVCEPFSFIPLLHTGALLGWWQFLTGRHTWVPQRRTALTTW